MTAAELDALEAALSYATPSEMAMRLPPALDALRNAAPALIEAARNATRLGLGLHEWKVEAGEMRAERDALKAKLDAAEKVVEFYRHEPAAHRHKDGDKLIAAYDAARKGE